MVKERRARFKQAIKDKWSWARWVAAIKAEYREKGWTKKTALGKVLLDPWKFLRDVEERYKAKFPEYESPWRKKRRDYKDFMEKLEKTYLKYPSRAPVRLRYLPGGGAEIVRDAGEKYPRGGAYRGKRRY